MILHFPTPLYPSTSPTISPSSLPPLFHLTAHSLSYFLLYLSPSSLPLFRLS